jgi:hypothetical protein
MWCNYQPKHFASAPTEPSNACHSIVSGAVGQQKVIVVMIPVHVGTIGVYTLMTIQHPRYFDVPGMAICWRPEYVDTLRR